MVATRLYIGRLSADVTPRDLERLFKDFGRVLDISLKHGFSFIELDSRRGAVDAIRHLDNTRQFGHRYV